MAAAFPNSPETQTSALSPQSNSNVSLFQSSNVVEENFNWLGSPYDNLTFERAIDLLTLEWGTSDRIEWKGNLESFRLQTVAAESATKTFSLEMKVAEHFFGQAVAGNLPPFLHQGSSKLSSTRVPSVPYLDVSNIMSELSKFELKLGYSVKPSPLASAFESLLWCFKAIADLKQERILFYHTQAKKEQAKCTLNLLLLQNVYLDLDFKSRLMNSQRLIIADTNATLERYLDNLSRMRYLLIERSKAYSEIAEILYVLHELESESSKKVSSTVHVPLPHSTTASSTAAFSPSNSIKSLAEKTESPKTSHSAPQSPSLVASKRDSIQTSPQQAQLLPSHSSNQFSISSTTNSIPNPSQSTIASSSTHHTSQTSKAHLQEIFTVKHQKRLETNKIRADTERRRRGLI